MAIVRWFSRFVIFNCGRDIEYNMRNELFTHLTSLGPDFYERHQTGDLMSRMINDLTAVRMMVGMGVLTFTNTPLTYAFALAIMFSQNSRLTAAAIIPYVLLFAGIKRLTHSLMERSLRVQEGLGSIGSKVQESLAGVHVVKAYNLEEYEAQRFREMNDDYNQQNLALARLRGAMMPMIRTAMATSVMVVLVYGGSLVMARQMTIGELVAFMGYLGQLAWPTTSLGWMLSLYQRGKAAMKRLDELFDAVPPATVTDLDGRLEVRGAIEWDHVSFSYFAGSATSQNGHKPYALKDVSVKVPPGGKLAIVGRTGSGKSTMVKLLVRMMEPTSGRILLDGTMSANYLSTRCAARSVSFPRTPRSFRTRWRGTSLLAGRRSIPGNRCRSTCRGTRGRCDGSAARVGDRGRRTRHGAFRRPETARDHRSRHYLQPSIVVLDDALSSVDTETERSVLQKSK